MEHHLIQLLGLTKAQGISMPNYIGEGSLPARAGVSRNGNKSLVIINKGLLVKRDPYTQMLFAYTIDPVAFKAAFASVGVPINSEGDIPSLVELLRSGGDKIGAMRHPVSRTTKLYFSVQDVINNLKVNPQAFKQNKDRLKFI